MWEVEFYVSANGVCSTREFLLGLRDKRKLNEVLRAINLLREFGNELHRPHADYLEREIYELRISSKRKQIRLLYFFFYKDAIVISHGLRKEARVSAADIDKATRNKTDYFARHERNI